MMQMPLTGDPEAPPRDVLAGANAGLMEISTAQALFESKTFLSSELNEMKKLSGKNTSGGLAAAPSCSQRKNFDHCSPSKSARLRVSSSSSVSGRSRSSSEG